MAPRRSPPSSPVQRRRRSAVADSDDVSAANASAGSSSSPRRRASSSKRVSKAAASAAEKPGFLWSILAHPGFRNHLMPIVLSVWAPLWVIFLWMVIDLDGSRVSQLAGAEFWNTYWSRVPAPSWNALMVSCGWMAFQVFLLIVLPGRVAYGPETQSGYRPWYRLNGPLAYCVTLSTVIGTWWMNLWEATFVYQLQGELIVTLTLSCLVLTALLIVKGLYWPSHSGDSGLRETWAITWFNGMELYPSIAGYSLKQIVNCRFSMMLWACYPITYCLAQAEMYGDISPNILVSTAIVVVYLFKFFVWEHGYMCSLDIILDRFGFYIFWGCMVYVTSVYTSFALHSVHHRSPGAIRVLRYGETDAKWDTFVPKPVNANGDAPVGEATPETGYVSPDLTWYTPSIALANLVLGLVSVWCNFHSDDQRYQFRRAEDPKKFLTFGQPARFIRAPYVLDDGIQRENLILTSGYWGISRRINYVFEWALTFAWQFPTGFAFLPQHFYGFFLFILLVDRSARDDRRCRAKYGDEIWDEYARQVPWRIIPGIF